MILQGTALRALRDIDVVQDLAALGWFDPSCTIRFLDTLGEVVLAPPERNIVGEGYSATLAVRRQAVHEVLSAHVAKVGVPIRMGATVDRLDDRGNGVDAVFSDGSSGRYDMVVGCDGIRSRVRALAFPGIEPEFAGFCNWRMILPCPDAADGPVWM